ncbi:MAG: MIP/aquaporin family protein [Acidimicrobiia bacterium]
MNGRRLLAEFIGTAVLLAAIVGSGIVVSADGSESARLFQHAVVVGAALSAMIFTFESVSGAHFNPSITIADAVLGGMSWRCAIGYLAAQMTGGFVGVGVTNWLFGEKALAIATVERVGVPLAASEALATFGLVVVVFGTARSSNLPAVALAVGTYITAAIFFTSSAAFANPAVTLARVFTSTWAGIAPNGLPAFLAGQAAGTVVAIGVVGYLYRPSPGASARIAQDPPAPQRKERSEPRLTPD